MRQRLFESLAREQTRLLVAPVLLSIGSPAFIVALTYATDRYHILARDMAMARDPVLLCLFLALAFIAQPYALFETLAGALPQRWYRVPLPVWQITLFHMTARLTATCAAYYGAWYMFSLFYPLPRALLHPLVPLVLYGFAQSLVWTLRHPVLLAATFLLHFDLLGTPHGQSSASVVLYNAWESIGQLTNVHGDYGSATWSGGSWTWLIVPVLGYVAAVAVLNVAAIRLDRKGAGFGAVFFAALRRRLARKTTRQMAFRRFHDPYHAQYWFETRFRRRPVIWLTALFIPAALLALFMNGVSSMLAGVVLPIWLACIAFAGLKRRQASQQTVFLAVRPVETATFAWARLRTLYTSWLLATLIGFGFVLVLYMVSPLPDKFPWRSLPVVWELLFRDPGFLTALFLFLLAGLYLTFLAFGTASALSSGAPLEAAPSRWRSRASWAAPFLVVLLTILLMTSVRFERIISEKWWAGLLLYEAAGALLITHVRAFRFARGNGMDRLLFGPPVSLVPALATLTAFVTGLVLYFGVGFESRATAVFVLALAPLALYPAFGELLHVRRALRPGGATLASGPDAPAAATRFSRRVMILSHVLGMTPVICFAFAFMYSASDSYLHKHRIPTSLAEFERDYNWNRENDPYAVLREETPRLQKHLKPDALESAPFVGRFENIDRRWADKPLPRESMEALAACVEANQKVFNELDALCQTRDRGRWSPDTPNDLHPQTYGRFYYVVSPRNPVNLYDFVNRTAARMIWAALAGDDKAILNGMRDLRILSLDGAHELSTDFYMGRASWAIDLSCFALDQVLRRGVLSEETLCAAQKECRLFEQTLLGPPGSHPLLERQLLEAAATSERERNPMLNNRSVLAADRKYLQMARLMDLGLPEMVRTVTTVNMCDIMTLPFPDCVWAEWIYTSGSDSHGRPYSPRKWGCYLSAERPWQCLRELRIAQIKIALLRYRIAHGSFPDTLEPVGPEFLEQAIQEPLRTTQAGRFGVLTPRELSLRMPGDPFTGQSFQYRKTSEGFHLSDPSGSQLPWPYHGTFDKMDHFFPIRQNL